MYIYIYGGVYFVGAQRFCENMVVRFPPRKNICLTAMCCLDVWRHATPNSMFDRSVLPRCLTAICLPETDV